MPVDEKIREALGELARPVDDPSAVAVRVESRRARRRRRRFVIRISAAVLVVASVGAVVLAIDPDDGDEAVTVAGPPPDPPGAEAPDTVESVPVETGEGDALALFFEPPVGYVPGEPSVQSTGSGNVILHSYVIPSRVVSGASEASIDVVVMRIRAEMADDDPVALLSSLLIGPPWVEQEVGGRRVAVAERYSVIAGDGFGQPDRVGDSYNLRIGDAWVQIHTDRIEYPDAPDQRRVVDSLVASIDEEALAGVLAAAS